MRAHGWRITGMVAALLAAIAVGIWAVSGFGEEFIRAFIRAARAAADILDLPQAARSA